MGIAEPTGPRRDEGPGPWVDGLVGRVHGLAVELLERWDDLSDGSRLTMVHAIEHGAGILKVYCEDPRDLTPVVSVVPGLTEREIDVLKAIAEGGTTASAAEALHVSVSTVRTHVKNVLRKLGMHSRTEAVAWALQRHLIQVLEFR